MMLEEERPTVVADVYDGLRSYQMIDVLNAGHRAHNFYYEPRLGKTRSAVRCSLRWFREYGVDIVLVIGPLTPLEITWTREWREAGFGTPSEGGGPNGYLVPLLEAPPQTRAIRSIFGRDAAVGKIEWIARVLQNLLAGAAQGRPTVILLNDDVLRAEGHFGAQGGRMTILDLLIRLAETYQVAAIRDEAHRDLNAGSGRAGALRRLARYCPFRRALTGTPDPNGYINFYSQFLFTDPAIFGTSKARFIERYVETRDLYGREIVGYRNVDELLEKVRAVSSIVRARDHFDVPPVEEIDRRVTLPVGARANYNRLASSNVLEIADLGVDVDATHQLARMTRLQQLAAGYLPVADPERDPVTWLHTVKLDSVVADLAEPLAAGQKIVVSHHWRPEGEKLAAMLRRAYGNRVVHELNGRTTADRSAIIAPFDIDQDVTSDARILVSQEATGGVGISFARADHLHFVTWSFDYASVAQMAKRTWHPDKTRMTETYHAASATIDIYARSVIRRKANATIMARDLREHGFRALAEGATP